MMNGASVAVVRGQVAPGCAGAKNPEHSVAEAAVVPGVTPHFAGAAGEARFQDCPGAVGAVVAAMRVVSSDTGIVPGYWKGSR